MSVAYPHSNLSKEHTFIMSQLVPVLPPLHAPGNHKDTEIQNNLIELLSAFMIMLHVYVHAYTYVCVQHR